jgi:CubicO group peptidase (beta-lactamase class C family)
VVAIARRGRLAHLEAYGYRDRPAGVAMTEDTLFWAASMTKPMTVAGALMLHEEGRLPLGDAISTHLPAFAGVRVADLSGGGFGSELPTVPPRREPTVLDLMRHTAGIVEGLLGSTAVHRLYADAVGDGMTGYTGAEFAERLSGVPLLHEPGEMWHYGWGIDLLGFIIEKITGLPLHGFLRERLFTPLGMTDTTFGLPDDTALRYARPLPEDPETGAPQALPDLSLARFDSGGAGVVTTAGDYLRFALMLLGGGRFGDERILGPKTVQIMTSDQLPPGADDSRIGLQDPALTGYGFGLGVAVRLTDGQAATPGSAGDYNWGGLGGTYFWVDPKEKLIAIWMMQAPGQRVYYRGIFRDMVYGAMVQ